MLDLESILANIRHFRKVKQFTQRQMAEKLFVDPRTYSKIETGKNKTLDVSFVVKVACILEVEIDELLKPNKKVLNSKTDNQHTRSVRSEVEKLKASILTLRQIAKEARYTARQRRN